MKYVDQAFKGICRRSTPPLAGQGGFMRSEALFINGVFDEVLQDIEAVQEAVPE